MQFEQIDPADIPNMLTGRRGRVSYPIIKGFLETGYFLAKLDMTGVQQSQTALRSSLTAYIKTHNQPIKIFSRKGDLFMMRLDIDEEGEPIENWQEYADQDVMRAKPTPITPDEVAKRYEQEKGQVTK